MICKVKQTLERNSLLLRGKTVCVALSGGADSMSLLYALNELKTEYGFSVKACHVNHGIRGESADRDEAFVREQCKILGIELSVKKADIPKLAAETSTGLEECGRRVRYEFFSSIACDYIATAHTLSDKCETLLLNITRGSSLKGLCSIPEVRGNIIRPLIDCTRDEIEEYCRLNNIPFVTDETNSDDSYSRNRVRLNIIPELKKINPSFEQAVKRLTESVYADESYLDSAAESAYNDIKSGKIYNADKLMSSAFPIRMRTIGKIILKETGIIPEAIHLKMIDGILGGGKTEIIGDTVVEVKDGILCINPEKPEYSEWEYSFDNFFAETPSGSFRGEIFNKNELPRQQFVHNNVLDFDCISGRCVLRNRRAGDKMKCAGSSCTKTLKKLFNEKHLENRNSLAVLADGEGILWVQGIGCSDRCKIKRETENILLIREELKND